MDVASHMTNIKQSECITSELSNYASMPKYPEM